MPSDTKDGEFTECDGDLQDEVGIYTTNGQGELSFIFFDSDARDRRLCSN